MSAKFNNMLMTGGAFNFAQGDINFNGSGEYATNRGIDRLFSNVAQGGFHDSGERFDAPKCHPNTRVVVIQEILDWLDDQKSSELVMWLHGAAGAGKSAIAQTIAQILFEQGRLSGSFFFARGSTTGRGDDKRLVPTLAYQLAKYRPETRAHIAEAVMSDPSIFNLTLLSQVQSLLTNPLWIASNAVSSSYKAPSRLFIIDGLDECHDADAQCRILQVFAAAVKSMQHHLPQKLLIASRSEMHLSAVFNELNTAAVCRRLPLDNSYRPNDDIRLFLQDSFSKVKREHRMRAYLEHSWPPHATISSLVRKSSGQFIYASTVVKFIASPRHHPAERLKIILGLTKTGGHNDRPFAALDSLYTHIFQSVEDIESVLCIMRIALGGSFAGLSHRAHKEEGCRTVLGMSSEELELALVDLISVIRFNRNTGWFTFIHASIPDFLLDPHRSRIFYVDQPKVNLSRAECCVKAICNIYSNKPHGSASPYSLAWAHLSDCTGRLLDPADKELFYQSLSSLDMCRALDHHFLDLGRSPAGSFKHIGLLLLWSLQEHQTYPEATSLSKLTNQFDVWFLSQLKAVSINGFDNKFEIDLMVFAMTQFDGDDTLIDHRLNILGFVENGPPMPSAALAALGAPSAPDKAQLLFPWYLWVYAEKSTEYFTLLRHFFHDLKRAGKYFMSGARYANAALHCLKFLFATRHANSRNWDEHRWALERETLYLAVGYAVFFLGKATATKGLFELLLGTITIPKGSYGISTVIPAMETNARYRLNSRIDMMFTIGQSTSGDHSLGVQSMFDHIFLSEYKSVAQWQEESVQRLATAISEYVSTKCRSFFPVN